jgi:hypothetical protein
MVTVENLGEFTDNISLSLEHPTVDGISIQFADSVQFCNLASSKSESLKLEINIGPEVPEQELEVKIQANSAKGEECGMDVSVNKVLKVKIRQELDNGGNGKEETNLFFIGVILIIIIIVILLILFLMLRRKKRTAQSLGLETGAQVADATPNVWVVKQERDIGQLQDEQSAEAEPQFSVEVDDSVDEKNSDVDWEEE